jgi:hypothetical protein
VEPAEGYFGLSVSGYRWVAVGIHGDYSPASVTQIDLNLLGTWSLR